jgi:hypothetical protein
LINNNNDDDDDAAEDDSFDALLISAGFGWRGSKTGGVFGYVGVALAA